MNALVFIFYFLMAMLLIVFTALGALLCGPLGMILGMLLVVFVVYTMIPCEPRMLLLDRL